MPEYKQISTPIGKISDEFAAALKKVEKDHEATMDHDLRNFMGQKPDHDSAACAICKRRAESAKYCHECGRPYEDE